jgi:diacylglycerol kinase family enzyme
VFAALRHPARAGRTRRAEQQRRHRRTVGPAAQRADARAKRLLLVVNARASGVDDPARTAADLIALLQELDAAAEAVITQTEDELIDALRWAAVTNRRVVLVGGDGSVHSAANAPLPHLPELALVPAGRANNVARALHIPGDRPGALAVAAAAPAIAVDALLVQTPERALYAVEGVSAGFQAEARARYAGPNSGDLLQGVRALIGAILSFSPYRIRVRLDSRELHSAAAAQLFLANLPYFGFGFEVDPGANPADGRLEVILLEARRRRTLLRLLATVYRGRHLFGSGAQRISTRRAELIEPVPLVADAIPLGTTTATVSVQPARMRVAAPAVPAA